MRPALQSLKYFLAKVLVACFVFVFFTAGFVSEALSQKNLQAARSESKTRVDKSSQTNISDSNYRPLAKKKTQKHHAKSTNKKTAKKTRSTSHGNNYDAGNCTWYAKNKRPDLPNNLGNADSWVANAKVQGIATGSEPKPGAIGQSGMHVVYVEEVHNDGTISISEMNYQGLGIVSSRVVPANNFTYIY